MITYKTLDIDGLWNKTESRAFDSSNKVFRADINPITGRFDRDLIEIIIDQKKLTGSIQFIGVGENRYSPEKGTEILNSRPLHKYLKAAEKLPNDTRLWAALQNTSGGTWTGCIYDVDKIIEKLEN